MIRWNALAMVLRANTRYEGIGGHLSTYASAASLYEVGFNHFFRGWDDGPGDLVYFQGHAAPGVYARAFLEGRLTAEQLDHFRREALTPDGLPSYPHPRTMPDFWQFPTVSMGLGPLSAIYQARFNRYLAARGLADTTDSRVWAFVGDGEMDEPEALAGLSIAAREGLDNLIFVVNCNLQRLDGPVRGNGKIIQELESVFRGAGWHVIKVIWSREWDALLERDTEGVLLNKMTETARRRLPDPVGVRRAPMSASTSSVPTRASRPWWRQDRCRAGGAPPRRPRLPQALCGLPLRHRAQGRPGRDPGQDGQGLDPGSGDRGAERHPPGQEAARPTSSRSSATGSQLPIPDDQLADAPYYHPGKDSPEIQYLLERRRALGGTLPRRTVPSEPMPAPSDEVYSDVLAGAAQPASTTMAFGRLLRNLVRDPQVGRRVVPIIPDEARTFGMDPLFKELGIYNPLGQQYAAGRPPAAALVPGGNRRPDPGGGHHRGRLHGLVHRGRHRRTRSTASR